VQHVARLVEKFRTSGMTSMRAYLNSRLESTIPVVTISLAIAGAVFGPLGPVLAKTLTPVTTESTTRPHRIRNRK
jgi:hypothetical protein